MTERSVRDEIELWERRDVTIDFVCACAILCGGIIWVGFLL